MPWGNLTLDILADTLNGRAVRPRPDVLERNAQRYGVDLKITSGD